MKSRTLMAAVVTMVLGQSAIGDERANRGTEAAVSAAWAKMKALVGSWEGTVRAEGKQTETRTSFRMVSGGSALMSVLNEGAPHEMVTMFHRDLKDLLATHYCAAQNQPRLKAVAGGSPNQVVFEFKDGTNIGPHDGHMRRVVFTVVDADRHFEDWTFRDKGKESTAHFEFQRNH